MSKKVEVKIERMHPDVVIPSYNHEDDSGMDVRAFFHDEWIKKTYDDLEVSEWDSNRGYDLFPGGRAIIPTGIKVAIPDGYEIQVRPRSGMAIKQGLTVLNTPGTVDAGYRGEIGIIVYNSNPSYDSKSYNSNGLVEINHGDRIAQLVLQEVPKVEWVEVESVDETTRGDGGFGSTGVS